MPSLVPLQSIQRSPEKHCQHHSGTSYPDQLTYLWWSQHVACFQACPLITQDWDLCLLPHLVWQQGHLGTRLQQSLPTVSQTCERISLWSLSLQHIQLPEGPHHHEEQAMTSATGWQLIVPKNLIVICVFQFSKSWRTTLCSAVMAQDNELAAVWEE